MNLRIVNLALLGLCLGLLGVVGYLVYLFKTAPLAPKYITQREVVTNTVTQIAVRKFNATNLLGGFTRPTTWSTLESTNYVLYIENLRGFGCPEETIRDLIITDIAKLYAKRRAALRAQVPQPAYWQAEGPLDQLAAHPEILKQIRALDQEQRALVKQLLGVTLETEMQKYWYDDDAPPHRLEFLSKAKQEQLTELMARHDEMEADFLQRTRGLMLPRDEAELRRLQRQRQAALAELLTPEELEAYELRNSPTAQNLRSQLQGFNASEEEFRKMFELQKVYDDKFGESFSDDDTRDAQIRARAEAEAHKTLEEELKRVLGEDRYKEYERVQDEDYRTAAKFAERFGLPEGAAAQVYDMKREAERQRQRVDANPDLTDAQKEAALRAIRRETERSLAEAIGANVYRDYRKVAGSWLNQLEAFTPAPPEEPFFTQ
jgi:hypothetical protein